MARASHLRLAAVDGRKIRGIRKPPSDARPLPPHVIQQAEDIGAALDDAEAALKALNDILYSAGTVDAVVVRALVRDAAIYLNGARGKAKWLATQLDDPAWLWR
jgi:hypothetical protein